MERNKKLGIFAKGGVTRYHEQSLYIIKDERIKKDGKVAYRHLVSGWWAVDTNGYDEFYYTNNLIEAILGTKKQRIGKSSKRYSIIHELENHS